MFRVVWRQSALNDLAAFWIEADGPMRSMITAAATEIDRRLASNPLSVGESRDHKRRFDFVYPLAITYQVDLDASLATILHVRVFRRRRSE